MLKSTHHLEFKDTLTIESKVVRPDYTRFLLRMGRAANIVGVHDCMSFKSTYPYVARPNQVGQATRLLSQYKILAILLRSVLLSSAQ